MSMFDLVMGNSGFPPALMDLVFDVTPDNCPRYRDHWLEKDGDALMLAVYTRMGGGNREEYAEQIAELHGLPLWVSDEDDTYDNTYSTIRFRMERGEFLKRAKERDFIQEGMTAESAWAEMERVAEPIPRNMAVIWEAMISTLPGNFGEKV